jgi:hypothetical protein
MRYEVEGKMQDETSPIILLSSYLHPAFFSGRGKSTSDSATFAPVSFPPQTSSSRQTGPGV